MRAYLDWNAGRSEGQCDKVAWHEGAAVGFEKFWLLKE